MDVTPCGLRTAWSPKSPNALMGGRKTLYIIDKEGFDLFKYVRASCLISPNVLEREIADQLRLLPTFNVGRLDGQIISLLLEEKVRAQGVSTFKESQSIWVAAVYKYVTSRNLSVDSYQKLPLLPLSNKRNTFISMGFWKDPRLLPPINNTNLRKITDQFSDIHLLSNLDFKAMSELATATSAERFLDYLYHLVHADCSALEKIFRERNLTSASNIQAQS
jgi:hypothetical protein